MAIEPRPGAVPFAEAIAYLREKVPLGTRAWTDLWHAQHAVSFVVAGATAIELVKDFQDAIVRAIAEGTTLEQFRAEFDRIVAAHGWSYNGSRGWRSGVIFNTNLRMAYQAGKWQQAQATKADRPWLRYVAVLDGRTRPLHRQWHGTILPVDSAWWAQHYPPNGWNCRCTVMTLSARDLRVRNWQVTEPAPDSPIDLVPLAGRGVEPVPRGIDPGFAYNVGEASLQAMALRYAERQVAGLSGELRAAAGQVLAEAAKQAELPPPDITAPDAPAPDGTLPGG